MRKKKLLCGTALLLCLALCLGACGTVGQGGTTTVKAVERPSFITANTLAYDSNLKPSVSPFTVAEDFSNVSNMQAVFFDLNTMSDDAKQMLRTNGFFVTDGWSNEFFDIYESNRYAYLANFVTVDSIMHTYHLYFAKLLKGVEKTALYSALLDISNTMQKESAAQLEALRGTPWETAAKRNLAYFTVACCLLQPQTEVPGDVSELVAQELALIDGAGGIANSPILNYGVAEEKYMEDYTQYIPRSYYTTSEELSRYFRAMMWYGRLTFVQSDEEQTRSALLMTTALENSSAMETWEKVYTVTSFFVGASDDLGVYEYANAVQEAYKGWPQMQDLPKQEDAWKDFCKAITKLQAPVINSIPVDENEHAEEGDALIKGFRFMGQRTTLDAAVFQQLVYQKVGENTAGENRMLPSGLDFTAALGSALSAQILQENGADDYANYTQNMATVKAYLADAPESVWNANLYSGWVSTLRPLTVAKGEGWPQFMQNDAWAAHSLNSFLGSWTELKHDTVLYAKQVYAEMGGGGEMDQLDDRGYVEPEPELYARLAALAQNTADGLAGYGMLNEEDEESLARLSQLALQLMTISEKELKEELPTDEEFDLIRTYGGHLEHFWQDALAEDAAALNKDFVSQVDFPAAIVTDVATDPNGSVLEEGTGKVDTIYVVVNVDGVLRVASGSVFSYYEFEQPLAERLTDKQWRLMLGVDFTDENGNFVDAQVDVPRPSWTSSFRLASYYAG